MASSPWCCWCYFCHLNFLAFQFPLIPTFYKSHVNCLNSLTVLKHSSDAPFSIWFSHLTLSYCIHILLWPTNIYSHISSNTNVLSHAIQSVLGFIYPGNYLLILKAQILNPLSIQRWTTSPVFSHNCFISLGPVEYWLPKDVQAPILRTCAHITYMEKGLHMWLH